MRSDWPASRRVLAHVTGDCHRLCESRWTAIALRSTRSCRWVAVLEAPQAAIRSSSHSSMKTENWFQLRIVGVTNRSRDSDFGRSPLAGCGKYVSRACTLALAPVQVRDTFGVCSCDAEWLAAVARRGSRERGRAPNSSSIWRSRTGRTASEASGWVSLTPSAETSTIVRSTGF